MTAGHRNQGRTCPKGSARDAPSLLGGTRGFLLGAPSSKLGECTSAGRERTRELGVCLNLLGSCPKKTGAPGLGGLIQCGTGTVRFFVFEAGHRVTQAVG